MNLTPDQMASRVRQWATAELPDLLRGALRTAATIISATSVGRYMRDDKGGGARSPTDTGNIRILTGSLAAAAGSTDEGPNRRGAINRISTQSLAGGLSATLEKGVSLAAAPGGYNEGRTAKSGRDLSFLEPAVDDSRGPIKRRTDTLLTRALRRFLGAR